mgnify:CR=1 FL=1
MLHIIPQPTPNPNAMKFNLSRTVVEGQSCSFNSPESAAQHPLAARLFEIDGIQSVFMLKDFITVGKRPDADWEEIIPAAMQAMRDLLG